MGNIFNIQGRPISENHEPYVVAEISGNHGGKLERALNMIELAADAGADAVKLQTFTPDTMTLDSDRDEFLLKEGLWKGRTLYDLYKEAQTPWDWHKELFAKASSLGLHIFSSPFDESAVDFLETLDVPAYKVASFEVTDHPLLKRIAQTKKPVIMSTGMAVLDEVKESIAVLRDNGCKDILILHCVSQYPTDASTSNIKAITTLREELGVEIGLSDHSPGNWVAIASVSLGARFIEKHFIDDKSLGGADVDFSLEPEGLRELVNGVKTAWKALGNGDIRDKSSEKKSRRFRRSIYFVKDMKVGEIISRDHIKRVRPANGLEPRYYEEIIGKPVKCDILKNTPAAASMIEM